MLSTFKCKVPLLPQVFHFSVFVSPSSFSANTNQNREEKDMEMHMKKGSTVWLIKNQIEWSTSHMVLLSGHTELLHCNDNMITQKLSALVWPESRSAGMGPWWRKCNSVEKIRFRLLDPVAKLSSWRYTSVWTLIGSSCSGTVLVTEHGRGKNWIIINWAWPFPNRCYP